MVISVVGPGRPIAAAGEPETVSVLASSVELWTGTGLGWAYTLPRSQPVCHGGMAGRRAAGNLKLLTHKFDCSVAGRRRWALSVVSALCCSGSALSLTGWLWHTWSPAGPAPTFYKDAILARFTQHKIGFGNHSLASSQSFSRELSAAFAVLGEPRD